jgi:hypothetical protein
MEVGTDGDDAWKSVLMAMMHGNLEAALMHGRFEAALMREALVRFVPPDSRCFETPGGFRTTRLSLFRNTRWFRNTRLSLFREHR